MNGVKIVATIGPRTESAEALVALRQAGTNVVRLNGSHGDLDWHGRTIERLRATLPDIPILLDLPGSKIRTASMAHDVPVQAGERVVLTVDRSYAGRDKVLVDATAFQGSLSAGDVLLIDDGMLRLAVREVSGPDVLCRAENAATLRGRKGIQMQGSPLRGTFLSKTDKTLLEFACRTAVDYVGLSFVERPAEVEAVRVLVGKDAPGLIAKIETQGAIDHLDEILQVSDAVMIDRGDLAVETNLERIALLQKHILARARRAARPVIVATQMLHSMTENPIPTKAEVCDITNAVLEGASALMLSGETAVGKYPVEAVSLMRRVADAASDHVQDSFRQTGAAATESIPHAVADAIALMCRRLEITKIVVITISGYAGRMIAATMPRQPILAVSNDQQAARSFNLLLGTRGIHVDVPFSRTSLDHVPRILEELWRRGELIDEDLILVTTVGYPNSGNRMNLIETHRVSDLHDNLGWRRTRAGN
jgi:pyruvate kinase